MQHVDKMHEVIGSAVIAASLTMSLTGNVQAQVRPLIEPASIRPPGAVGLISGTQLIDHGGARQAGGHFVGIDGAIYVNTGTIIQQVTPGLSNPHSNTSDHNTRTTSYTPSPVQYQNLLAFDPPTYPGTTMLPTSPYQLLPTQVHSGDSTQDAVKRFNYQLGVINRASGIQDSKDLCEKYGPIGYCIRWKNLP